MHHRQTSSAPSDPPIPISITICGDGGCGKSSITLRLVRSQWVSEYDPTIEDSYSLTRTIDGHTYHLSLTDTAGQEEYRGMWASSNLGADAFLLVYDITSRDSLEALQYFVDLIDMETEVRLDNAERARRAGLAPCATGTIPGMSSADLSGLAGGGAAKIVPPVKMVAGNKCDLAESRDVPAAVGLEWARNRGCLFMETSARLKVNVEETFGLIIRRVVEQRRLAAMGALDDASALARHGMTKPLTPLPSDNMRGKGDDDGTHGGSKDGGIGDGGGGGGGVGGRSDNSGGDGFGRGWGMSWLRNGNMSSRRRRRRRRIGGGSQDQTDEKGDVVGLRSPRSHGQQLGMHELWRRLRCW